MEGSNSTFSQELANWLADLRTQWSGKIEQPLRGPVIFLYAFLGALTLFSSLIFVRFGSALAAVTPTNGVIKTLLEEPLVWLLIAILPSLGIAWLVSWPKRPYSPARIYLGSLAFSALVCLAVMKVLSATSTIPQGAGS